MERSTRATFNRLKATFKTIVREVYLKVLRMALTLRTKSTISSNREKVFHAGRLKRTQHLEVIKLKAHSFNTQWSNREITSLGRLNTPELTVS